MENLRSKIASRLTAIWIEPFPAKATFWRLAYDWIAGRQRDQFTLMNLGYASEETPMRAPPGPEQLCLELYHHVVSGTDLRGKMLLEVGCGRAGGLAYVKQRFEPVLAAGIDLSERAVSLARERTTGIEGLQIRQGDATDLPFAPGTFDVVLNIESSHCYPSRQRFYQQVHRVLGPRGVFLYADFFHERAVAEVVRLLRGCGFAIRRQDEISKNVVFAMERDEQRRIELLSALPVAMRGVLRQFVGARGSWGYLGLSRGWLRYLCFVLQRR